MNRPVLGVVVVLTAAAVSVGACASPGGPLRPAAGNGSTSSGAATVSAATVSAADLAATVRKGLSGVRSVHVALAVDFAGRKVGATGDETLHAGKVDDLQLATGGVGGSGPLRLVLAGGAVYAKLAKPLSTTGKPYVLISKDSRNARVRRAAERIEHARDTVSLTDAADLLARAKSVRRAGRTTIDGAAATQYIVQVDPAALAQRRSHALPLPALAFVKTVDVRVYLDAAGRPVRIDVSGAAGGQTGQLRLSLSRYNQPVTITAPPADQVGTA